MILIKLEYIIISLTKIISLFYIYHYNFIKYLIILNIYLFFLLKFLKFYMKRN